MHPMPRRFGVGMAGHGTHGRGQRLSSGDRYAARRFLRDRWSYDLRAGRRRRMAGTGADSSLPTRDGAANGRVPCGRGPAKTGGLTMPPLAIDGFEVEVPANTT